MTYRKAVVYYDERRCGILEETDMGYRFTYDREYFLDGKAKPVSLTLPKDRQVYESGILFPFFDGLIPEGFLLNCVITHWGLSLQDRFGALLKSASDSIGAVWLREE